MSNSSLYVLKPKVVDTTIIKALKFVPTELGFAEFREFCGDSFVKFYTGIMGDSIFMADIKINTSHYAGFAGYDIGTLQEGGFVLKYLKNGKYGDELYIITEDELNKLFDRIPNGN